MLWNNGHYFPAVANGKCAKEFESLDQFGWSIYIYQLDSKEMENKENVRNIINVFLFFNY